MYYHDIRSLHFSSNIKSFRNFNFSWTKLFATTDMRHTKLRKVSVLSAENQPIPIHRYNPTRECKGRPTTTTSLCLIGNDSSDLYFITVPFYMYNDTEENQLPPWIGWSSWWDNKPTPVGDGSQQPDPPHGPSSIQPTTPLGALKL